MQKRVGIALAQQARGGARRIEARVSRRTHGDGEEVVGGGRVWGRQRRRRNNGR